MSLRRAWRGAMPYLLGSPWLALTLAVTAFFLVKDIGSIDPAASGLISVRAGTNGDLHTLIWFLAALSVVVWPFLFLWQEQIVNSIERSGYLSLLLASRMSERRYRRRRIGVAASLCGVLALVTLGLGVAVLAGIPSVDPLASAGRFLVAALAVYLPNLLLASSLALLLSRVADRAVALAVGLALPFLWLAAVGYGTTLLPGASGALWLSALEPSGVVWLSHPAVRGLGRDGGSSPLLWLPFVLNRALWIGATLHVARRYLSARSSLEAAARQRRPVTRRRERVLLIGGATVAVAAIAGLLAIGNLQSNFAKNLRFYSIRPSMPFLFRAGLPGIQAYLLAALFLLVGKWVWQSRESGFATLERASALTASRRLARLAWRWLAVVGSYLAILGAAVAVQFGGEWAAIDWLALAHYVVAYLLPGLALATSVFLALSVLAPGRVTGYASGAVASVGYLILMQQPPRWLVDLTVFPGALPGYASVRGAIAADPERLWAVLSRVSLTIALLGLLLPLLNREALMLADYLSPRTRRLSRLGVLLGGLGLAVAVAGLHGVRAHRGVDTATDLDARRYAAAAERLDHPAAFEPRGLRLQATVGSPGDLALDLDYALSRRESGAWIPVSWIVRPAAVESVTIDGEPARHRLAAPGLWLVEAPPRGRFHLGLRARVADDVKRRAVELQSFFGRWPSLPVIGVLPELFAGTATDAVERFRPAGVSRVALPVAMTVDHPCAVTVALPGGRETRLGEGHCRTARDDDRPLRGELYLGIDVWHELRASAPNAALRLLVPAPETVRGAELLESAAAAVATVHAFMRPEEAGGSPAEARFDLTVVAGDSQAIGESNALSKPGVIFLSVPLVLDTALAGRDRAMRDFGLLAHESMHQWYGHAVRPRTGRPGAIFVNEVPAEFARGYALRARFGDAAYDAYLAAQKERLAYVLATQSTADGVPLDTTESDEIYPRAALLARFIAGRIGWDGLARNLRQFALEHADREPVTAELLLRNMVRGLSPEARTLATRLATTDLLFVWHASTETLEARCSDAARAGERIRVPVGGMQAGERWLPVRSVSGPELAASDIRAIALREE